MRHPIVPLLALLALVGGCTSDVDSGSPAGGEAEVACDRAIDDALAGWAAAGFSGSFTTSVDGSVECEAAFGLADREAARPNTPGTVFEIGSITKSFTAAAIFQLIDDGTVALDDAAGSLVADLTGPAADVTVEQLLLHTSGLTGEHGADHEPLDRDAAVAAIGGLELAFAPGTDEAYSNAGYTLLALIVEAASEAGYRERIAADVLPLPDGGVAGGFWDGEPAAPGPRAVGYFDDGSAGERGDFAGPHWALDGNGGLAMTVPQLAAWTAAFFAGDVVSPASVEAMSEPRIELGDGASATYGWAALDASVLGEPALAAAGGGGDVGHDAITVWLPGSRRVISIASNTPAVTAEDLVREIGPALVAGDPLPSPPSTAPAIDAGDLGGLEGTYELDTGGTIAVAADGSAIELAPDGPDAVAALFPLPASIDPADVPAHEQQVLALLAGATAEGRDEREALEADIGPLDSIALAGTIFDDELRTYVAITSGGSTTTVWYALEDGGSIAAVEIADLPTLRLVATTPDTFRPEQGGGGDAVTAVAFGDDRLIIGSAATTVTARRRR